MANQTDYGARAMKRKVCVLCLADFFKGVLLLVVAMLPMMLVLDFGMGIVLVRDYEWPVILGFVASVVFCAEVSMRVYKDMADD